MAEDVPPAPESPLGRWANNLPPAEARYSRSVKIVVKGDATVNAAVLAALTPARVREILLLAVPCDVAAYVDVEVE